MQGILDVPLSDRGRAEVACLAAGLPEAIGGDLPTAVYCGPGESVVRTAEAVAKALGLRPSASTTCATSTRGSGRGSRSRRSDAHNRVFRQWLDDPLTVRPAGETVGSAMERIKAR
ncbi:MAG: histidine phosphatase family protein [Isosphaeraceae bacterium]